MKKLVNRIFFFMALQCIFFSLLSATSSNDLEKRYRSIKQFLNHYQRSFTTIELDASADAYSLKIAQDYSATCVMSQSNNAEILLKLCQQNPHAKNLLLLKTNLLIDELVRLGECEHFDVIFVMNGLTKYGKSWQKYLDAILNLGDHTIIELTCPKTKKALTTEQRKQYDYLLKQGAKLLATFPCKPDSKEQSVLFLITKHKTHLARKYWFYGHILSKGTFVITSTFTKKTLYKKMDHVTIPWMPGINLLTFQKLEGIFPTHQTIRQLLEPFKDLHHTDLNIWNIIIQGSKLVPIDGNDERFDFDPHVTVAGIINQFKEYFCHSLAMKSLLSIWKKTVYF